MHTVLIVDDDDDVRATTSEVLESFDFDVLAAANGLEALGLLQTHPEISVLLLDIMMPDMDGFDVSTHVWRLRPMIPILFLTGVPILLENANALKGVDYILKPYAPTKLVDGLNRLIGDSMPEFALPRSYSVG